VLLAIDAGNTETKLGLFHAGTAAEEGALAQTWRLSTGPRRTADEYGVTLAALFRRDGFATSAVRAIVISSVVPQKDQVLAEAFRTYFGLDPVFFTAASQRLMTIDTERPAELGADLAASAIAARALYGSPAIVIGFGTATTFGAIDREGRFLGTALAPGMRVAIDALVERAAKLPQFALSAPPGPIGRDTVTALRAGFVYGFVGLTEGLVARMKAIVGAEARVVATGGLAEIIAAETRAIDAVQPHLVLYGLRAFANAGAPE